MNTTAASSITFTQLLKLHIKTRSLMNIGNSTVFFAHEEQMKKLLQEYIRTDFSGLKAKQLLQLNHWAYLYKPCSYHSYLMKCGELCGSK